MAKPAWKPRDEDEGEGDEPAPKVPVEPNGADLTRKADNLAHTKEKMQATADAITKLLQDEQKRQARYRKP